MFFVTYARLRAATMAHALLLSFDPILFNTSAVRRFLVIGYGDHDGALPSLLKSENFPHFELQRHCAYSIGD